MITAINDRNFLYVICCLLRANFNNMPNPIFEQLKRYLSIPDPDYACMINGKWGSGKTYFLNKELKKKLSDLPEYKDLNMLYASANGVSSFANIAKDIVTDKIGLNPKAAKLVGHMFKFGANFIPGASSFTEVDLSGLTPFNDKDVVIIDDLERVHNDCDLIALLGEINSFFVEHKRIKTILVCDESEIYKRFAKGNDRKLIGTFKNYTDAKEKVVAHTFVFTSSRKEITTEIAPDYLGEFLSRNGLYNDVEDYFRSYYCENIRTIKFFLNVLDQYVRTVGDEKALLVFSRIVPNLLYYSIKFRENRDPSQNPILSNNIDKSDDVIDHNEDNSWGVSFMESSINLLKYNILDKDEIIRETDEMVEYFKMDQPEYSLLESLKKFENLEDAQFDKIWSGVKDFISQGKYNLFQIAELLYAVDYGINEVGCFGEIKSRKESAIFFEVAFNKVPIVPHDEQRSSLKHNRKMFDKLENSIYDPIKVKFIDLVDKQNAINSRSTLDSTINTVLSRGIFDEEKRELEFILFKASSTNDLAPFVEQFTKSNAFKKSFVDQLKRVGTINRDMNYLDCLNTFYDSVSKPKYPYNVPGLYHLKMLRATIENLQSSLKETGITQ